MSDTTSSQAIRAALIHTIPPEKIRESLRDLAEQSADPATAARARTLAADYGIDLNSDHHASHTDPDAL
jgi:hypothetical protein